MGVIRVVVAGSGTDGHGRWLSEAVARRLRDAGLEVVRTHDTAVAAVARTCVQEDAAAVCVPGAALATGVREALVADGAADVLVVDTTDDTSLTVLSTLG